MRYFVINLVTYFILTLPAFAETIQLKNGRQVEGQIIERSARSIRLDIAGIGVTYFMDEIESVLTPQNPSEDPFFASGENKAEGWIDDPDMHLELKEVQAFWVQEKQMLEIAFGPTARLRIFFRWGFDPEHVDHYEIALTISPNVSRLVTTSGRPVKDDFKTLKFTPGRALDLHLVGEFKLDGVGTTWDIKTKTQVAKASPAVAP